MEQSFRAIFMSLRVKELGKDFTYSHCEERRRRDEAIPSLQNSRINLVQASHYLRIAS